MSAPRRRILKDWLQTYMQFTNNTEPPASYHYWCAISAICAVLQRKCYLPWGLSGDLFPNFYIVLVGPPGGRKGTAMKIAKGMLHTLGISLASDCITRPAMIQEIEAVGLMQVDPKSAVITLGHSSLTVCAEEFAVFLGEKNPDMVITLTDLFDCPSKWVYSTKNRGQNHLSNVFLNIIGATTPSLLQSNLTGNAIGGGLTSRMIFVVERGKAKHVPLPFMDSEETQMYQNLLHDLSVIHEMEGPFKLDSDALNFYVNWYTTERTPEWANDDRFGGYYERRSLHLRKLAMCISASRSNDRIITLQDFMRALTLLENTESHMSNAFYGVGANNTGLLMSRIVGYIHDQREVSYEDILKKFKFEGTIWDISQCLQLLDESGEIRRVYEGTKQRIIATRKDEPCETDD